MSDTLEGVDSFCWRGRMRNLLCSEPRGKLVWKLAWAYEKIIMARAQR